MEKSNIAIIGCGNISNYHISALKELKQNIVGIYDIDQKKTKELSKRLNCKSYQRLEDIFKIENLDGIIIATPNYTHYPILMKAIDYGKNIFCEKPMTTDAEDSYRILKKVEKSKVIFQVGYMRRHNPGFITMKNIVSNQLINIYSVYISLYTYSDIYNLKKPKFWYQDVSKSGGYFLPHSGSHLIDIMRFLFSDPVSLVSKIYYIKNKIDIGVSALFEYEKFNVFFNITVLPNPNMLNSKTYWEEKIEIIGKEGRIILKNFSWTGDIKLELTGFLNGKKLKRFFDGKKQWINQMKRFVDSVKLKRNPSPDVHDGYMVDLIIKKLKESNLKGKRIKIK